jgi:hypothetical protein
MIKVKLLLSSLNLVVIIEIGLGSHDWIVISILFLVLPDWESGILLINILVPFCVHCYRRIWPNILPQGFLNYSLNRKLLARLNQHLSSGSTVLYELEKGIVSEGQTLLLVVQDFISGQARVLQLLQLDVDLSVNALYLLLAHIFGRASG